MSRMQWSRLKKQVEAKLCLSLGKRIQFHTTRFDSKGEYGKFWILCDRQEIFAAYDVASLVAQARISSQLREINSCSNHKSNAQQSAYYAAGNEAEIIAHQQNIWSRYECESALKAYLNLSIEQAFDSENSFIKALSLWDSRVGKRRLLALDDSDLQHPLVRQFFEIRCQAEQIEFALS